MYKYHKIGIGLIAYRLTDVGATVAVVGLPDVEVDEELDDELMVIEF